MKFVTSTGEVLQIPDAKAEPTQELLSGVYDALDLALDYMECVYMASQAPDGPKDAPGDAMRAVLEMAQNKVTTARDKLHDTIAWAPCR